MIRLCRFLPLLAVLLAGVLPNIAYSEDWEGKAIVVPVVDGDFEDGRRVRDLERLIEQAGKDKAAAIVFEIDTRHPADWDAQQRILEALSRVKVPVYSFVNSSAIGPGAMLALASRKIYLSPGSLIGAAGLEETVKGDDDEKEKTSDGKRQMSVLKATARSLAKANGHRVDVAEAFIDPDIKVMVGSDSISPAGEVLTLTADEALAEHDGKTLLGEAFADDVAGVLGAADLPSANVRIDAHEFGLALNRDLAAGEPEAEAEKGKEEGDKPEAIFGKRDGADYKGKVVVMKVGMDTLATGKASFDFMDRTLKKAELDGAEAVIFDMDTPGGIAWYTQGLVLDSLQSVTIPTYTFVNTKAESAGAIVALGTDAIYMRPAATIGSALVVSGTGQDLSEAMESKVTQMIIATVRNIAELKGHNPDVAEAFVTRDKEVKIDGVVIHEAGNVLNLNTIEATENIGGRPVLAKGVARSLDDIVKAEGLKGAVVDAEPLGMEAFAHWVQKLSFLLIIIGLGGAYLEINTPGFGLPGLASVCAFSLFFFGNYMAGNLAGYELAVLFVVGLLLIVVEVFVFPGAIIPGAAGAALIIVSLGLAMVDRVDLEWKWEGLPSAGTWYDLFRNAFWSVAIGFIGALGAILLGMRYLPDSKLGSRLVLKEAVAAGASISTSSAGGEAKQESYVGREGVATTDLVPSGKGMFEGKLLDIVSEGEFIERGDNLRITRHEGSRIVVARA